ncbi:FAD-dependent monooxygenase [Streptomyces sp. NPDC002018]|uniref:FAD-dependent monooxygenase n=1 Tax=Streptomyces sp. NPDC002018 TaxID=3364629 RepID=UPI0036ACE96B
MEQQVVVAGAGPVGLWLAAELRRAGVSVTVVEEREERDTRSKALTVHPRTLEVLASRGVHETFLGEGVPIPGGHFGMLDARLDFRRLRTPFPHTLALPQARTEELFEGYARELGARILRGHRVTGLDEGPDAVTVEVTGPDGAYTLEAAYAVGCDGTRSVVRTAAGIGFPGTPSTVVGWLGDVVLDSPPEHGYGSFGPHGGMLAVRLPGGLYRLVGVTPRDVVAEWPGDLTLDELRSRTVAVAGHDFGMRAPAWLSRFGNATHLAERYRHGRTLLAGDAAHQHFPAGGVGMNVGIQDAHNLGWKLAAVLRGRAPDALLDTYHSERHPVGDALIRTSRAQVALMTAFTAEGLDLRALLSELVVALPEFNDHLAARVSGLHVAYPPATPTAHPLTGTRAPDLALALALAGSSRGGSSPAGLFSLLRADSMLLLDLTDRPGTPPAGLPRPGLRVHTAPLVETPADWNGVRAALIRPDGHIAWAGSRPDDPELFRALAAWA